MGDPEQIVRDFCAAWSRLDADELAAFFTEDGVYHNMPAAPVAGRVAVRDFIAGFSADWLETDWEIVSIAAAGDRVFCERVDRTRTEKGEVALPCLGVFELENGLIARWRDYFDLGTYLRAIG